MHWIHKTKHGTFHIQLLQDRRYHVIFDGEDLGGYSTPQQAADDVSGGHTFMPSSGIDTGLIGLSEDIGDWERVR